MNTPSHTILNLAILSRKGQPKLNLPIVIGSLLPDLAMFWFYFWARGVQRLPEGEIWGELYYDPVWQDVFDVGNSIPLALLGFAIAAYYRQPAVTALFASVLLHCLFDLPLHNDDAHRHFLPFSNFRFESPISYWDPDHYGNIAAFFEVALVLITSVYVFRNLHTRVGKGLLVTIALFYLAGFFYFYT